MMFDGKLKKLNRYLFRIFNFIRCCIKKFSAEKEVYHRIDISSIRSTDTVCRGAVLVEFAVWMPLLIILLFYIYDLMKMKRYYSQTEFVGQQIANMIQNISQRRSEQLLTKKDFQNITAVAWLTMFPGKSLYKKEMLGYVPGIFIYYVKGVENGKAKYCWRVWSSYENTTSPSSEDSHWDFGTTETYHFSTLKWNNESVSPSSIYPSLKISSGESKIIVEAALLTNPDWKNQSGQSSTKQKYGFHLATPRINGAGGVNDFHLCFNSVTILTPKNGLFSETKAPE